MKFKELYLNDSDTFSSALDKKALSDPINNGKSDIYYNKIIRYLNNIYPKLKITIVSEGDRDNFKEIVGKNLDFKLNETIDVAFHTLVSAKILVTSKSSFSYSAAILNSNNVYYINFWHKPLNHWKNISYLQ